MLQKVVKKATNLKNVRRVKEILKYEQEQDAKKDRKLLGDVMTIAYYRKVSAISTKIFNDSKLNSSESSQEDYKS